MLGIIHYDPIHYVSLVVCVMLIVGVMMRRRKAVHIPIMISAIVIDLGMVLYIELSRGAIKAAEAKLGGLMIFHIAVSVLVLALYGVHIWTGIRKARGGTSATHGRIMLATVGLRIINFITSVMVMGIEPRA